jgi:hypothetical protein
MTYTEFMERTEKYLHDTDKENLDEAKKKQYDSISLNLHRSRRIFKTYTPSESIRDLVGRISSPQLWMVITEDWCGDSAQNLPIFASLASLNKNIDLRIVLRDENPDIMNHYLTNGISRSIPILVVFDKSGNELFRWGPRPEEARELVDELKSQGYEKKEFLEKLHLWYARNRGKNTETELTDSLSKLMLVEAEQLRN